MPKIDAIRFRNYKSFGGEYSTIPLKRITVLIGRNNSGKSSCIDVIESLSNTEMFNKIRVEVQASLIYDKAELDNFHISTINSRDISSLFAIQIAKTMSSSFISLIPTQDTRRFFYHQGVSDDSVFQEASTLLSYMYFFRLNAERDVLPEHDNHSEELSANGTGATSLINHILNHEGKEEQLVQHDLLKALNEVMTPDAMYSGITVQKAKNELWEVYLYEDDKRYALSKMGSGLKTIILVLLNLIIVSKKYYLSSLKQVAVVFAFEELENNLHPALQRRLFDYIDRFSKEHLNTYFFLTTHSHIPINMFANQEEAQILHVTKVNGISSVQIVDGFITKSEVLNDLDVRASDLLQSNGIIWVEGPSDRIYIKHWMEIWGGGNLREGIDYQFLYYGGRLLSHYTADESANQEEQADEKLIEILKINRNAIIVMDSDITKERPDINKTKERVQEEFKQNHMLCWITAGKEIENYIPYQAISKAFQYPIHSHCSKKQKFANYIKQFLPVSAAFKKGKVPFAHEVVKYITVENASVFDVQEKIENIIDIIRSWTPDKQSAQT